MGIRLALEAENFELCGQPQDARSAIAEAMRARPAVCLIDARLPGGALVAVDAIYRGQPQIKLLVLTGSDEPRGLLAALRAREDDVRAREGDLLQRGLAGARVGHDGKAALILEQPAEPRPKQIVRVDDHHAHGAQTAAAGRGCVG
jgi:CheY-like chemotaxis protein